MFLKNIFNRIYKYSPEILMGISITGVVTTTIFAIKATPKAEELLKKAKKRQKKEKIEFIDVVKTCYKPYIPMSISAILTVSSIIGSNYMSKKQKMALATLYSISENALKVYQEKVIDQIGETKHNKIKDSINKEKAEKLIDSNPTQFSSMVVSGTDVLFCDTTFNTWFVSNMDTVRRAVNSVNYRLNSEDYISLNEFYGELNVPPIEKGFDIGWNIGQGLLEVHYTCGLTDDRNPLVPPDRPYVAISYNLEPRYDYSKLM